MESTNSDNNVISEILRSWTAESHEEVESSLVKELELVTVLDLGRLGSNRFEIGDDGIVGLGRALQQSSFLGLKSLVLRAIKVGDKGTVELAKAIEAGHLSNLGVLDLGWNDIGVAGAQALAQSFESGNISRLHHLDLWGNPIGDRGLIAIALALESGHVPSLKSLDVGVIGVNLQNDGFHFEAGEALANAFRSGNVPLLESLTLLSMVEEEGVISVIRSLELPTVGAMKNLCFNHCHIGVKGAMALAEALHLPQFSSLLELDLYSNESIGDEGVIALSGAFRSTNLDNLQVLNLSRVSMGERGLVEMATLLEEGHLPSLQEFCAGDSADTQTSAQAFVRAYLRNGFLIAKVDAQWPSKCMKNNAEGFRKRNEQLFDSLKLLLISEDYDVPMNHGKVFICGQPEVSGALRKSLCSRKGWGVLRSTRRSLRGHEDGPKGIEVSQVVHKKCTLELWDVAGQPGYDVLHSSIFPDLAFADSDANVFVVVCRTAYRGKVDLALVKEELNYWMRYIASTCIKGIEEMKRQVLVVFNSFQFQPTGEQCCLMSPYQPDDLRQDMDDWLRILSDSTAIFHEYLIVHPEPFVFNVKDLAEVKSFQKKLLRKAESLLKGRRLPKICAEIQEGTKFWWRREGNFSVPVLNWYEYCYSLAGSIPEDGLHAVTEYLHQTGQFLYLGENKSAKRSLQLHDEPLVILEPHWFYHNVVGKLLIPDSMVNRGESGLRLHLRSDGSIPISALQEQLSKQLGDVHVSQLPVLISALLHVGLAFRMGQERVIIPSLIDKDGVPDCWTWTAPGQWVMGFALTLEDRETNLLPIALFNRLQVQLSRDRKFGGRRDSQFVPGANRLSFTTQGMAVVVEYCADPINRLDVLVRPLVWEKGDQDHKEMQINLAQVIVDMIVKISKELCPGVELTKKAIEPWIIEEGLKAMALRNAHISVDEVRRMVKVGGINQPLNWTLEGTIVRAHQLLSRIDLERVLGSIEKECDLLEKAVVVFNLSSEFFPIDAQVRDPSSSTVSTSEEDPTSAGETTRMWRSSPSKVYHRMSRDAKDLKDVVLGGFEELKQDIHRVKSSLQREHDHLKLLIRRIQALENVPIADKENSVPRFVFLAKKGESKSRWLTLEDALSMTESPRLHFLCEARYPDRALHVVDRQEGLKLSKLKEWAGELAPLLDWSMRTAFILTKIAGTASLPGLGMLLSGGKVANAADLARANVELMSCTSTTFADPTSTPQDSAEVRRQVRAILSHVLDQLSINDQVKKLNLTRVTLPSAEGFPKNVYWICNDCIRFGRHGKKATEV